MIGTLIDKQDGFERVRDAVAAILAVETVSQQALAVAASKDPTPWELRVYEERSDPWELFLNIEETIADDLPTTPIVNVWFESSDFPGAQGGVVEKQLSEGTIVIDCYALGISEDKPFGHLPGDLAAALEVQRAVRLCRNILMAADYTYLAFDRGELVGSRWLEGLQMFQPQLNSETIQHVAGARLRLRVKYNETSPQIAGQPLEIFGATIKRGEDGSVYAELEIDYTT